jgi:hypothetical protein
VVRNPCLVRHPDQHSKRCPDQQSLIFHELFILPF